MTEEFELTEDQTEVAVGYVVEETTMGEVVAA